jgi:hypothetical protein
MGHSRNRIRVMPMELKDANAYVERLYRHHKPVIRDRDPER